LRNPFTVLLLYVFSSFGCVFLMNWQLLQYRVVVISISLLAVGYYMYVELRRMNRWQERLYMDNGIKDTIFNLCLDGIFLEDEMGNILDCNRSGHEIFGYTKEEMLTKSVSDLVPEEFAATLPDVIPNEMATGGKYVERVSKRKDGSVFPTEINTNYVTLGKQKRLIAYLRDITERKEIEDGLRLLSVKDDMTGVFNRRYVMDQFQRMFDRLKRFNWDFFSVGMLDIDDFKEINDTYGHVFGDEVLRKFSRMLERNVRTVDVIGRYGGEEFLLLFPYTAKDGGETVIKRLLAKTSSLSFSRPAKITFSAGLMEINYGKEDAHDIDSIINKVDELMYRSKKEGKNRVSCI